MIFKYLDLETSVEVIDNIEIIRNHQLCIIRNANIKNDESLYYSEPLDENDIELLPENPSEAKLLTEEIGEDSFYYDRDRDKYLSLDTTTVTFYMDGTGKKKQYFNLIPGVPSSEVPFKINEDYCIIGYSISTSNIVTGTIVELRTDGNSFYSIDVNNTDYLENNTLNLTLINTELSAYINDIKLSLPVLIVKLKKIYYPEGA